MNMNLKNTKSGIVRIIGLPVIYILSFYCLYGTSVFKFIEKLSGSALIALIIINAIAFSFLLVCLLSSSKIDPFVIAISVLYLSPGVLSHSKFDWFKNVLGIKFTDGNDPLITAILTLSVISISIFISRVTKFDEERLLWIEKGGNHEDLDEIFAKRVEILFVSILAIFIPMSLIVVISSISFSFLPVEPAVLALAGTVAAILTIYFFSNITSRKKAGN